MTLRTLAREIRDYPATACFSLIWVLVFVAMVAVRMHQQPAPSWWQFLVLGMGEGHRFGDLTLTNWARARSGDWSHARLFIIACFTSPSTCWRSTCWARWLNRGMGRRCSSSFTADGRPGQPGLGNDPACDRLGPERALGRRIGGDHGTDRALRRDGLAVTNRRRERSGLADVQGLSG